MDLASGVHITPSLRLIRLLAEGAMGQVWVADHLALDLQVAVKFIRTAAARRDSTLVARFEREAHTVRRITSPHVVQIFDQGATADGVAFIVMELLRGMTLAQRLVVSGVLETDTALSIVDQAAIVVDAADTLGIVHRDLKPENLFLLDSPGQVFVKVLDFGLARLASGDQASPDQELTHSDTLIGTPAYMAPEQYRDGRHATVQSDLWSLAVTFYKMLTGRLPFEALTAAGMAVAVCSEPFTPVGRYRGGLPVALDRWFERALAKAPNQRFANVRAFMRGLEQALEGQLKGAQPRRVIDCIDEDLVLALIEGRLSERELEEVEGHLDVCAACLRFVALVLEDDLDPDRPLLNALLKAGGLPNGQQIARRYRIERLLGNGPPGPTYDATDVILGERVALKTLPATGDERALRALLSGARQLQRIQHANLAALRDVHLNVPAKDVVVHLAVYEFIDGPSLHAELRRVPGSVERTIAVLRDLLQGLSALHAARLVHGHLHPRNAIARAQDGADPSIVLVGAGLAPLVANVLTHYTPPEQARGEPPCAKSDIFSCGAIAFEMLTARRPWLTGTLRESTRDVPSSLVQILETWVSADPAARPHDAAAALSALDAWQR
jgi:serine/threonine-protein kinase